MTTLLTIFIISLFSSLILTPVARYIGNNFGLVDIPDDRKVHTTPIPRIGGLAIILSFIISLLIINLFDTTVISLFVLDYKMYTFLLGAFIVFGIGLFDDFRNLGPTEKLLFQIIAASTAFYGGIQINGFHLFGTSIEFGIFSYFITVFWFLLFINAVNLADGLDGLAAGIVLFVCLIMVVLLTMRQMYLIAMITAALGGSTLGFLRYNFNPASIFLGDGGSYFLGYTLAALSIMGAFKSQISAIMLIPFIALGVPLFDTLIAPIRRFVYGQNMFRPDSDHIHHRLIKKRLSHHGAVIVIYAATFILFILAIILVNIRNEQIGLFLILVGICAFIVVQKLGYFEYFAVDKVVGWFRDVGDEIGISNERRSFLSQQVNICNSENLSDLWKNTCIALERLTFDMAEIHYNELTGLKPVENGLELSWLKDSFTSLNITKSFFKLELPLLNINNDHLGTLFLYKDLKAGSMDAFTLRRVELLRRTLIRSIEKLISEKTERQSKQ